ncbi:hypothetical protein AK812_SmicGene20409 [Symbiodinium microadriaticum]|uniref:Uncharacterized protein n=1 Tax=Symbiodinium microadriaticum TaxID=2951 RepID=A0A1Q9DQ21_SYMMI|nr:hypothetical protein AK812_SmicGene20409 [Symbiodinium microadriaticum]
MASASFATPHLLTIPELEDEASLPIRPPPGLEDLAPASVKRLYEDSDAMSTFVGTEAGSLASMSTSGYSNSPRESLHLLQDLCNFREALMCRMQNRHLIIIIIIIIIIITSQGPV